MSTPEEQIIYINKGEARFPSQKGKVKKTSFRLRLAPAHAVVVQPSFCCPAVIAPDAPLVLTLLMNDELAANYHQKGTKSEQPGASDFR